MLSFSLCCVLRLCVCICVCTLHAQRIEQISNYGVQLIHPLTWLRRIPASLSFVNFSEHFLFIRHSCQSVFSLFLPMFCTPSMSTYVMLFSLSFPLPFYSMLLHLSSCSYSRSLRQPSSIIRWTGRRYTSFSSSQLSSSFSSSSSFSPALWPFYL